MLHRSPRAISLPASLQLSEHVAKSRSLPTFTNADSHVEKSQISKKRLQTMLTAA